MRVVDLIAPLGRGSRALIVAAQGRQDGAGRVGGGHPHSRTGGAHRSRCSSTSARKVTHFRRSVPVEVLASSTTRAWNPTSTWPR
ncbi:MAG: hypothetical protein R2838_16040 [Caldilineaceae bacterium]